jgi:hypothetical protein
MRPEQHLKMHIEAHDSSVAGAARLCGRSRSWLRAAIDRRKTITFDFAGHFAEVMRLAPHARRMLYLAVARENLPEDVFKHLLPDCSYDGD